LTFRIINHVISYINFCPIYSVTGKVTILFFKRDRQFLDLAIHAEVKSSG